MPLAARPVAGCDSRSCLGRSAVAKRHLLVGIRLLMGNWRVPALPNKRFEPMPRACMLTPEVVERLSVFNFGLIISQFSERTTNTKLRSNQGL
jgi:hypothetical protein